MTLPDRAWPTVLAAEVLANGLAPSGCPAESSQLPRPTNAPEVYSRPHRKPSRLCQKSRVGALRLPESVAVPPSLVRYWTMLPVGAGGGGGAGGEGDVGAGGEGDVGAGGEDGVGAGPGAATGEAGSPPPPPPQANNQGETPNAESAAATKLRLSWRKKSGLLGSGRGQGPRGLVTLSIAFH